MLLLYNVGTVSILVSITLFSYFASFTTFTYSFGRTFFCLFGNTSVVSIKMKNGKAYLQQNGNSAHTRKQEVISFKLSIWVDIQTYILFSHKRHRKLLFLCEDTDIDKERINPKKKKKKKKKKRYKAILSSKIMKPEACTFNIIVKREESGEMGIKIKIKINKRFKNGRAEVPEPLSALVIPRHAQEEHSLPPRLGDSLPSWYKGGRGRRFSSSERFELGSVTGLFMRALLLPRRSSLIGVVPVYSLSLLFSLTAPQHRELESTERKRGYHSNPRNLLCDTKTMRDPFLVPRGTIFVST
eukprot:gene9352-6575_t